MSRFSLPPQRPAVHSVTPHEALRGTEERDAVANTALATALHEELEHLRRCALRLGTGR